MNVFIALKCADKDAGYFIQQLEYQDSVKQIFAFRDTVGPNIPKTKYITSKQKYFRLLMLICRLFKIITMRKFEPKLIVGIYEIPHGLLAVLSGLILSKPSVVSIIGNPGYKKLRKGLRWKLTLWMLQKTTFVTVTGNSSKKYLVENGVNESKIFVLPNTLDFTNFEPKNISNKKYDIISLGRLSGEKRIDTIIKIVDVLRKDFPDIKVAIGGNGKEKQKLEELINSLNLNNNIALLGYIPDEDLAEFYSNGKLFLLTSETEGFPRTIIQAAACGTPVVASNVGDMTDVIEHDVDGFCINKWDSFEEYIPYIKKLLVDNELNQSFSEKLNIKVRNLFNTNQSNKVWSKIINQIKQNEK